MKYKQILFIISTFLLLNIFVISANANDVGYINYSSSSEKNYNLSGVTAAVAFNANYLVFHKFILDTGNYTSLNTATVYTSNIYVFPKSSDYTTFSFTSGATGSGGYVSYVYSPSAGGIITYIFNPGMVVTSSQEVVLNLATNIFSGITNNATYNANGFDVGAVATYPLNLTHPFALTCNNAGCGLAYVGASTGADTTPEKYITYDIEALANVSIQYNFSYFSISGSPYFNGTISKPGASQTIPTIVRVQNQTIYTYAEDSALSSTSTFNAFGTYSTGLYANITDSHGDNDIFVINSTGTISPTPAPTAAPIPSGSDASITFSSDSYGIGDAGTVITNTSFGILDLYSYRIDFYSQTMPLINQYPIDKSQSSQSFVVQFPVGDVYTANIVRSFPLTSDTIIASDTAQAVQGSASIIVPIKAAVGKNFTVYYTFDYQPATNNMCGLGGTGLFLIYQTDGSIKQAKYLQSLSELTEDTNYSINMSAPTPGNYIIQARDCSQGIVGTSIPFTIEFMSAIPEFNISTSYINLDSTTIYDGDVITGQFGIDNTNWTQYGVYYAIYNYTNGEIFRNSLPGSQTGSFSQITEGYDLENNIFINNLIPTGTNKISLRAFNGSNDFEIAYANFTFSRVTASGYDLSVDKMCVPPTNTVKLSAVVPSGEDSHILIARDSDSYTKTIYLNTSQTILYAPTKLDHYIVTIFDSGDNSQKWVDFTSSNYCNNGFPGAIPTSTPVASGASATSNAITSLLQSTAFWGLVFVIGMMLTVAIYENRSKKQ